MFARLLLRRHSVLPGFDLALGFTPLEVFIGLPFGARTLHLRPERVTRFVA